MELYSFYYGVTTGAAPFVNNQEMLFVIGAIGALAILLVLFTLQGFGLYQMAKKCGVKIISSMGTGNKLNPTMLEISDIYKTSVCPLARVMRTELKKRGIKKLKVLFSKEEPIRAVTDTANSRHSPASVSFVPSVAGLIIAGEVICDIAFAR